MEAPTIPAPMTTMVGRSLIVPLLRSGRRDGPRPPWSVWPLGWRFYATTDRAAANGWHACCSDAGRRARQEVPDKRDWARSAAATGAATRREDTEMPEFERSRLIQATPDDAFAFVS